MAVMEVVGHALHAAQHALHAVGIVLEIAQHLSEVRRPGLELADVGNRHAQHFRRYGGGKRLGEIRDHVHVSLGFHLIEQRCHDALDVRPQHLHAIRGENLSRQVSQAGVRRRIHEQHLFHGHFRNRIERGEPQSGKFFRRRGLISQEVMQDVDHVPIARDHPCVNERIPMDRIFRPQAPEERIRIGEHFGFEKMVKAEAGVRIFRRG